MKEYDEWEELEKELFTKEELKVSDFRVDIMLECIDARNDSRITQEELNKIVENEYPLDTLLDLLVPQGKTLAIVPLEV
ncbi:MAG: transcriptional regulator [Firmicutes bacterium]|nr:transcriptional regulator [Bacillota bacterium]